MQQFKSAVIAPTGAAIPGASITVTLAAGGVPTLYSDDGVTALGSNVLAADPGGNYAFYAANGRYTLTITASGYGATTQDVILFDPDDADIVATVNILPNTRWLVGTGLTSSPKYNDGATGSLPTVSVSSYTTGANLITCLCSDTSALVAGQSLLVFNAPADANMRIGTALRVRDIVANTSFTCRLPLGLTASTSSACTATIYEIGGSTALTGSGFDGWTKTTTLQCWRDSFAANTRPGSKYSCGLKKGDAAAQLYYVDVDARDVASLRGKTIAAGGNIKCPATGSWRVFISDSVNGMRYGSTVTTTGYTWSEVAAPIADTATTVSIGFELIGASGLAFYLSEPHAGVGTLIGPAGGPVSHRRERIIPVVKFTPASFFNATLTLPAVDDGVSGYSVEFDAYAETLGVLAPEVRALDILLEGINTQTPGTGTSTRVLATRDKLPVPHIYGPLMFQPGTNTKSSCGGTLTLGPDGTARVYSATASDQWGNLSIDINGVIV